MRVISHTAEEVRELRRALKLTQQQLADRLGVSRRTIIRGEQRGIEVPWYSSGSIDRYELTRTWGLAVKEAADRPHSRDRVSVTSRGSSRSDTHRRISAKVSRQG